MSPEQQKPEHYHQKIDQAQEKIQKIKTPAEYQHTFTHAVDDFQKYVDSLQYCPKALKVKALKDISDFLDKIVGSKNIQHLHGLLEDKLKTFRQSLEHGESAEIKVSVTDAGSQVNRYKEILDRSGRSMPDRELKRTYNEIGRELDSLDEPQALLKGCPLAAKQYLAGEIEQLGVPLKEMTDAFEGRPSYDPEARRDFAEAAKKTLAIIRGIRAISEYGPAEQKINQEESSSEESFQKELQRINKIGDRSIKIREYEKILAAQQAVYENFAKRYQELFRKYPFSPFVRNRAEERLSAVRQRYQRVENFFLAQKQNETIKKINAAKKPEKKQAEARKFNQERMDRTLAINEKLALPHQQNYFQGVRLLREGNIQSAKDSLLRYLTQIPKDEAGKEKNRIESARLMLKQIGHMEMARIEMMVGRLLMTASSYSELSSIPHLGKSGAVLKQEIGHARTVLALMRGKIESGQALTIDEAERQVLREENKKADREGSKYIDAVKTYERLKGSVLDLFSAYKELESLQKPAERQRKLLELAKKFESKGLYSLAQTFYDQYFAKTYEKESRRAKLKSKAEIRDGLSKDPEQLKKIKAYLQEMKSKPEYQNVSEKDIANILLDKAADEIFVKQCKLLLHKYYTEGGGKFSSDAQVWNEYNKGHLRLDRSFYELWKFTHEEWDKFLRTMPFDLMFMILTAGAAGAVGKGVTSLAGKGLLRRSIIRQAMAKGLDKTAAQQIATQALGKWGEKGAEFLMARLKTMGGKMSVFGAKTIGFMAENTAFVSMGEILGRVRTGEGSINDWTSGAKAFGHSLATLGLLKGTGNLLNKAGRQITGGGPVGRGAALSLSAAQLATLDVGLMTANTYLWDYALKGKKLESGELAGIVRQNLTFGLGFRLGHLKPSDRLPKGVNKEMTRQSAETAQRANALEAMAPGLGRLADLRGMTIEKFISDFNKKNPEGLANKTHQKVMETANGVIAFDSVGKLNFYPKNAYELLVKYRDEISAPEFQKKKAELQKRISEGKEPKDELKKAKEEMEKMEAKEKAVAILSGNLKGFENYTGLRDLGKALALSIEQQCTLAREFIRHTREDIKQLINPDATLGKPLEAKISGRLNVEVLRPCKPMERLIEEFSQAKTDIQKEAAFKGIRENLAKLPVFERRVLEALLKDLEAFPKSITLAEKAVIFRESMAYLRDYKNALQAGGFEGSKVKTAQDILDLLRNNQRNLAHQTVTDRNYFTGSDHGVTHILEANMQMAEKLMAKLGKDITPQQRILVRQAIIDHDMGYTISSLENAGKKYFVMTKDHPLFSALYVEANKAALVKYFGEKGYEIYREAVLDHSNAAKFNLKDKKNLVGSLVAGPDCLGVTADIKMMKLFREPAMMAELLKLQKLFEESEGYKKQTPPDKARIGRLEKQMIEIKDKMLRMVAERHSENGKLTPLGDAFKKAIQYNLDPTQPTFAFKRDFGSHSAEYRNIDLDANRRLRVEFNVNEVYKLVRRTFSQSEEVSTGALAKAMDDFGLKLGSKVQIEVQRDGAKSKGEYGVKDFAADLDKVASGQIKKLIVETPRGTFEFTAKTEVSPLSERIAKMLTRDYMIRKTMEMLQESLKKPSDKARLMLNLNNAKRDLLKQFRGVEYKVTIDGRDLPATEVLHKAFDAMAAGHFGRVRFLLNKIIYSGRQALS